MILRLEQQRQGVGPDGLWGQWHVVDDATGDVVGSIVEVREALDSLCGLISYTASTDVEHITHGTGWCSTGHPTITGALIDLQLHLKG